MPTDVANKFTVPVNADTFQVPADMLALAQDLVPATIPAYASDSAANTGLALVGTKIPGQQANIGGVVKTWNGSAWVRSGRGMSCQILQVADFGGFGIGVTAPGGTTALYASAAPTVPAQGAYWVELEAIVPIAIPSGGASAGYVDLLVGGHARSMRFHSQGLGSGFMPVGGIVATVGNVGAGAISVNVGVRLDAGSSAPGIGYANTSLVVRAYVPEV